MTKDELKDVLKKHEDWLYGRDGGNRADLRSADLRYADLRSADLRSADLSYANLSYANLRYANLSSANLSYANLSSANLSYADLSYANLSSANLSSANLSYADLSYANLSYANLSSANLTKTLLEGINWLAFLGIVPDHQGTARAYKMTNAKGEGPFNGGINYLEKDTFEVPAVNKNVSVHCAEGINLATFQWCLWQKQEGYRLFMFSFNVKDAVCPMASDGKFRVKKCRKIGECDWQGNLK